ncbi:hypothetical protein ACFWPX_29665 [Nocardia sp. NPDC058518]|uniref:hypothetical protein n=1 Tax=Nocardia sp. NPDC058518 TaxID=3346534 RepID=UPI003660DD4B
MTRPDVHPILPSVTTVLTVLINPDDLIPHRRPELVTALRELHAHHRLHRSAAADLAIEGLPSAAVSEAAELACVAASDIEHTVYAIDCEVARRLRARSVVPQATAPRHSESVGAVLSRVVGLWIEVDDHRDGTEHLPAAPQLFELLDAYTHLSVELALGARQLPTPRRPLPCRSEADGAR